MAPTDAASSQADGGVGVLVHLASGSVASVDGFPHHSGPFRDPTEERFDGDEVVFTTGGTWRIGRRGWVDAGPGVGRARAASATSSPRSGATPA